MGGGCSFILHYEEGNMSDVVKLLFADTKEDRRYLAPVWKIAPIAIFIVREI